MEALQGNDAREVLKRIDLVAENIKSGETRGLVLRFYESFLDSYEQIAYKGYRMVRNGLGIDVKKDVKVKTNYGNKGTYIIATPWNHCPKCDFNVVAMEDFPDGNANASGTCKKCGTSFNVDLTGIRTPDPEDYTIYGDVVKSKKIVEDRKKENPSVMYEGVVYGMDVNGNVMAYGSWEEVPEARIPFKITGGEMILYGSVGFVGGYQKDAFKRIANEMNTTLPFVITKSTGFERKELDITKTEEKKDDEKKDDDCGYKRKGLDVEKNEVKKGIGITSMQNNIDYIIEDDGNIVEASGTSPTAGEALVVITDNRFLEIKNSDDLGDIRNMAIEFSIHDIANQRNLEVV